MREAFPPAARPLIEAVERLWPDATEVRLVGRRCRRHRSQADWELLAVPSAGRPRLLVPTSGRAAAASLQRFSAALSGRELLERRIVGAAMLGGGTSTLGDVVQIVDPGDDHIVALLEQVLGRPVTVSVGVGTDRANRKPVLAVFDTAGHPVAFAKVGDAPVAAKHVRSEARALAAIGEVDWRVVVPPAALAHRSWRGAEVLVMSALRPPLWRGRGSWPIPEAAADEVFSAFNEGRMPLGETPMWRRAEKVASGLSDPEIRDVLMASMQRVAEALGDRWVDVGGFHGDFTPWNLARSDDRVLLWDWERFETGVPRGFDRMHYAVNATLRERGVGVGALLAGLRRGAGRAVADPRHDMVIAAAYLVSMSCRYQAAAEDGAVRRAQTVLATLAELSHHLMTLTTSEGAW